MKGHYPSRNRSEPEVRIPNNEIAKVRHYKTEQGTLVKETTYGDGYIFEEYLPRRKDRRQAPEDD